MEKIKKTSLEDLENLGSKKTKVTEEEMINMDIWFPYKLDTVYTVRIVDPLDQDWIISYYQHYIPSNSPDKKRIFICPTSFGEECPVCKKNIELFQKFQQGIISLKEQIAFKTTKRKLKYVVQVLVRAFEGQKNSKGELINPIKIYYLPVSLKDMIVFWCKPKEKGGKGIGEIWNNEKGRDIDIIKSQKNFKTTDGKNVILFDYKLSSYNDISPLSTDEKTLNFYLKECVRDWNKIIVKDKPEEILESYEQFLKSLSDGDLKIENTIISSVEGNDDVDEVETNSPTSALENIIKKYNK